MTNFNFADHKIKAIEAYQTERPKYESLANSIRKILASSLSSQGIKAHKIESRAKDLQSFANKAAKPSENNPEKPKYTNPLKDITDLAGVRIITFLPKDLSEIDDCIQKEFLILEKTDKSEKLEEEGRFGYKSIHYLVQMKPQRTELTEYNGLENLTAEIQARTILQHAWAEMEHDIQYKSSETIPSSIKRRFIALAGMLEIADREFQAIQDEDLTTRVTARENVATGELDKVEITTDALKTYLDKKLSQDKRMSDFSYELLAKQLRHIGFKDFKQIEECVSGYDDILISRLIWGSKQGQILRFENLLLAGMGENYAKLHPWGREDWFKDMCTRGLTALQKEGIPSKGYTP